MPVEILVNSSKYYNQLKSGLNFTSPTDETNNLVGSVGERIRLEMLIDVRWYFEANASNVLNVLNGLGGAITLTRQAGSWLVDGFYAGDTIVIGTAIITINSLSALVIQGTVVSGAVIDGDYPSSNGNPAMTIQQSPFSFTSTDLNYITIANGSGTFTITRYSGSWITDGFASGAINIVGVGAAFCTSLDATTLYCNGSGLVADGNYPSSHATAIVYGTTPLTALIYKFGLIENAENYNILSKISNNDQAYYAAGIGTGSPRATTTINMQKVGTLEDWVTGKTGLNAVETTVAYVSTTGQYQRFKIIHHFVINPFYLEEWVSNFVDGTIPDLLNGLKSLKYVFEGEFRTVLSNPNTSKLTKIENTLGSVGWFNENFNGFNNNYSIFSVTYTDTGTSASCDGIQTGARTTVDILISTTGTFNAGDPFLVMVALCPEAAAYQGKTTDAEENFLYDDVVNDEGAASVSGSNDIIKNATAAITAGKLLITVEVEYTAAQQLLITSGSKFIIGCQVANDTLTAGNSDKVLLLADYEDYDTSPDIPNLMYVPSFEIFQHFVTDPTAVTGTTKVDGWNEDGLCFKFDFWLDLSLNSLLNSLKFLVIAYDATTGDYFILDQYAINLNNVIISGGVQQINISDTRGYKLNTSDYFNKVVLSTESAIGTKQYYKLYIGQKISWQDWQLNTDVDTIFYNSAKPQNNLNRKSSNYSALNGYEIKFALLANVYGTNVLGVSGNTDYLVLTPNIKVYDYNLPTTWAATVETFDETGTTSLGGAIRMDADTLFRITYVRTGAFNTGYNFWAINRIEENGEAGSSIYELSNIISSVSNNILKPVTGETMLKLTITPLSNTVVCECLIDYTKLDPAKNYDLSGRIDDGTAVPYIPVGKLTEDGTLKIAEDGDVKTIE